MSGLDYVSVEEARERPGLRLVLSRGIPAPWAFAARAIFDIKKIPYAAVGQEAGSDNAALAAWTGHNSAPVAMFDDERPRVLWSEQLMLAERLAPEPSLIPADPVLRAEMMGLCHELCAEDGLGWNMRTVIFADMAANGALRPSMDYKYGCPTPVPDAVARLNQLLFMLGRRLEAQKARGSGFFVGDALSAADVYWTGFSNLLDPMPPDLCDMPDAYRAFGRICGPFLDAPLAGLMAHRDFVARRFLDIPVRF